jgi:hypothetical protein
MSTSLDERIRRQHPQWKLALLREPVIMRRRQLLLERTAVDVASGTTQRLPKWPFRRLPLAVQPLYVIENGLGVAAVRPLAFG